MGQKVNPHGLRVGVIKDWDSMWYAEEDFADNLVEDYQIRKFLKNKLYNAGIAKIEIERASDKMLKVKIHAAKPGVIIGKGGAEIEKVKKQVKKLIGKDAILDIVEVKRADKDAQLVAENIAQQLEKRDADTHDDSAIKPILIRKFREFHNPLPQIHWCHHPLPLITARCDFQS